MAFSGKVVVGFSFTYDVPFYFVVVTFLHFEDACTNVLAEFCAIAFIRVLKGVLAPVLSLF